MSTHPNAILLLVLTPDGLTRKTYRAILAECGTDEDDTGIKIGADNYFTLVMESDYDDNHQISAPEGSIAVFDLFTYGYGEVKEWGVLAAQKDALEAWAKGVCERHHCSHKIYVTANYW